MIYIVSGYMRTDTPTMTPTCRPTYTPVLAWLTATPYPEYMITIP